MPNINDRGGAENNEPGYRFRRLRLREALGLELLGGSIYELDPGQRLWAYHWHHANEELAIVLDGQVTLRTTDGERPVAEGEMLGFRRGPGGAHQLRNDGDAPARILMLSTTNLPDLCEYPDSGKLGAFGGFPFHRNDGSQQAWIPLAAETDYYDGERHASA
ncbi:MAG: cupin domain-containing protein [Gaiellales bacterium]